jgi:hypothetical protein
MNLLPFQGIEYVYSDSGKQLPNYKIVPFMFDVCVTVHR